MIKPNNILKVILGGFGGKISTNTIYSISSKRNVQYIVYIFNVILG